MCGEDDITRDRERESGGDRFRRWWRDIGEREGFCFALMGRGDGERVSVRPRRVSSIMTSLLRRDGLEMVGGGGGDRKDLGCLRRRRVECAEDEDLERERPVDRDCFGRLRPLEESALC